MEELKQMDKRGFTLIESIIYIAAFIIIITLITGFAINFINCQAKTRISKEVLENSQRAMEIMLWEIKHAQDIYNSTSSFDNNPGQLSLITKQNLPDNEQTTYLDFFVDNGRLCLKREGSAAQPLTSEKIKVDKLIFSYLTGNDKSIRIELLAVYEDYGKEAFYQATTTLISSASLRNN